jgi:hypothetical protein
MNFIPNNSICNKNTWFAHPKVKKTLMNDYPITKHRDKWMGEYFDIVEFWSPLKNLKHDNIEWKV